MKDVLDYILDILYFHIYNTTKLYVPVHGVYLVKAKLKCNILTHRPAMLGG
jgi:hypothetical protein